MGIDFDRFRPMDRVVARQRVGVEPTSRVLLYVGRLEEIKGLRYLIDALRRLADVNPAIELVVLGEGSQRTDIQRRVDVAGLTNRVSFRGHVGLPSLAEWYAAADVVVLPSLGEGSPNVSKEAMACGTPVVATEVGGAREIAAAFGCGVVVPAGNANALANGIGTVIRQPQDFQPDIAHGRAEFGWEAVIDERLSLYRRLLDERAPL
jgi:teichuronic acid biosynthesis glycosyltransferase TuaC